METTIITIEQAEAVAAREWPHPAARSLADLLVYAAQEWAAERKLRPGERMTDAQRLAMYRTRRWATRVCDAARAAGMI